MNSTVRFDMLNGAISVSKNGTRRLVIVPSPTGFDCVETEHGTATIGANSGDTATGPCPVYSTDRISLERWLQEFGATTTQINNALGS